MTQKIIDALKPYCISPPQDLVTHFAGNYFPSDPDLAINVLRLPQAIEYIEVIQSIATLGEPFGLIALEDANNSNPYCYVSKGPSRGAVMYLCHDDASSIAFATLNDFLSAIKAAIRDRIWIEDLVHDDNLIGLDRPAIAEYVAQLVQNDGLTEEICVLVPLLSSSDKALMTALAQHHDFFIREAVAEFIASAPNEDLQDICQQLSEDQHPQVARPGKRALSVVNRLIHGN